MITSLFTLFGAILLLLFLMGSSVYIISLIYSWFSGAPYVSTRSDELKKLISLIPLTPGSHMIELGCGDGRVIRAFVQKYALTGEGYDVNPLIIAKARILAKLHNLPLSFHMKDIRTIDISKSDTIYLFLFPKLIQEIEMKLTLAIQNGSLIISHGFAIPFMKSYLVRTIQGSRFKTYVYHQ